jgi:hypothetical protein
MSIPATSSRRGAVQWRGVGRSGPGDGVRTGLGTLLSIGEQCAVGSSRAEARDAVYNYQERGTGGLDMGRVPVVPSRSMGLYG